MALLEAEVVLGGRGGGGALRGKRQLRARQHRDGDAPAEGRGDGGGSLGRQQRGVSDDLHT